MLSWHWYKKKQRSPALRVFMGWSRSRVRENVLANWNLLQLSAILMQRSYRTIWVHHRTNVKSMATSRHKLHRIMPAVNYSIMRLQGQVKCQVKIYFRLCNLCFTFVSIARPLEWLGKLEGVRYVILRVYFGNLINLYQAWASAVAFVLV